MKRMPPPEIVANRKRSAVMKAVEKLNDMEQPSKEAVHVVFSTDDEYAPYCGVAVSSLIRHASPDRNYEIFILADGLSAEYQTFLTGLAEGRSRVSVRLFSVSAHLSQLRDSVLSRLPLAAYYRLLLATLFPRLDRIVYCDCDVLVCHDIAELYDTELGDNLAAAVPDRAVGMIGGEWLDRAREMLPGLGLSADHFFNSGVLLMNLGLCRKEQLEPAMIELSKLPGRMWHDQDVLNMAFKNRWVRLDDSWNLTLHMYGKGEFLPGMEAGPFSGGEPPRVIHFARSSRKPWDGYDSPYVSLWWREANRSPFRREIHARYNRKFLTLKKRIKLFLSMLAFFLCPLPSLKRKVRKRRVRFDLPRGISRFNV